jgi:hypothetical protein
VTVGSILGDALALYRLLFRRSVAAAAVVYAFVAIVELGAGLPEGRTARLSLTVVAYILGFAGPVLVQGALVRIVRNVHEGDRPERIGVLLRAARARFASLFLAAFVYGVGVVLGLFLLIVPGLIVAARWSLMAPLIMLENYSSGGARRRSSEIVEGRTGTVLAAIVVEFLLVVSLYLVPSAVAGFPDYGSAYDVLITFIWGSLTAPFSAHVLTVIYYQLVDPDRPVIHENVAGWKSPWVER